MGFQENGNRKYVRMDSDSLEEEDEQDLVLSDSIPSFQQDKISSSSATKYVMACAIFASLNSVLLGYGYLLLLSLFLPHFFIIYYFQKNQTEMSSLELVVAVYTLVFFVLFRWKKKVT